jgi:hypothetical protein
VEPAEGIRSTTIPITVYGNGFLRGITTVSLGDSITVDHVTVVNSTSLTAVVTIQGGAATGPRAITLSNKDGNHSYNVFTVINPKPTIQGFSPNTGSPGSTMDIEVNGTGFLTGVTTLNFGPDITVSKVDVSSPVSLKVSVKIANQATRSPRTVTVTNSAPGGGASQSSQTFRVE